MNGESGYSGEILDSLFENECIVRGNTIEITLIKTEDSTPIDVTDCEMWIAFDTRLAEEANDTPDLEVKIPVTDAPAGTFSGSVTDTQTFSLKKGNYYVSLKFIDSSGQAFIQDIGKYPVHNGVNPRVELTP